MINIKLTLISFLILCTQVLYSQDKKDTVSIKHSAGSEKKWYDNVQIRGYVQVRYNRFLETNPKLKCDQCDKSIGENGGVFIRRNRVIIYGQINKRAYFYIQPDFASSASSTGLHFAQIRDAYFDIGLDAKNEFRFRFGQSKVPFGFENMQSSQNRLPLDRNDALNSAVSNERDMGLFFYWAPEKKRKLMSELVKSGLKGSGDYGIFALGAYNGQTANKPELNNSLHFVSRLTYPFEFKGQIFEPGIQAYTGQFVMASENISLSSGKPAVGIVSNKNYLDQRIAATFVLYPKPFGILAEYNIGTGPEYNVLTDSIENQKLKGGFVTFSYMIKLKESLIIPFTRIQYYDGGKKHELDARSYKVKELEIGVEYQPLKQFELVLMYTISQREFIDHTTQNNNQKGNLLRIQAQINF